MNQKAKFTGLGVATVTPFAQDAIDVAALRRIIDYQIQGGVDYIVCLGTTGEASMLTDPEKYKVQEVMLEQINGRLPLVLGIFGGNHTAEQIRKLQSWNLQGIEALLIASPAYIKPSQQGIYSHYSALAESTSLPIIIYNVPGRTSSNITWETTVALAENHSNIIGIKEASGDLTQGTKIIKHSPAEFIVTSGDDPTALGLMACGGDGVISVIANAYPNSFSRLVNSALTSDYQTAASIHQALIDLHQWLYIEGNPVGVKAVLAEMGFCRPDVRQPLAPLSIENLEMLRGAIAEVKIKLGEKEKGHLS